MKPEQITETLEQAAKQMGVQVRYDTMTGEVSGGGGLCKIKGQWTYSGSTTPADSGVDATAAACPIDATITNIKFLP